MTESVLPTSIPSPSEPLQVGLVGTGYAAKLRAEAFSLDPRSTLALVAGHTAEKTQEFSQRYQAEATNSWAELIGRPDLDLVVVANVNQAHGAIVRAALEADKHVVVEYPLALAVAEAEDLIALASSRNKLLHIEHIELLGGVHQALKATIPLVGTAFFARYATLKPERPAPQRWTYHTEMFGFPLIGALSRLHRLIDVFGTVTSVSCQLQLWDTAGAATTGPEYASCWCQAQLRFQTGLLAEVVYGKGEALWRSERRMEVQGSQAGLIFDGDQGTLVQATSNQPIEVGARRGLFAKDTSLVLDHLFSGTPLYITAPDSLYTLKVADAARRSAETGQTTVLN